MMGSAMGSFLPQDKNIHEKIASALKKGDAKELASCFNRTLDLMIPGYEGTYSNKQAEQILKVFFSENPPVSFSLDHKGKSNDGSKYMIGAYKSSEGTVFRIYILIKENEGSELIHQFQAEKD